MSESTTTRPPVGVKEVAAKVGTDPKTLRVFLRAQGIGVGSGKRYAWASMSDPAVKSIVREWGKAQAAKPQEPATDA